MASAFRGEYHQIIQELFDVQPLMATIDNYLPELSLPQIKEMMLDIGKLKTLKINLIKAILID